MRLRWQYLLFLVVLTSSNIFADLYDDLSENSLIDLLIQSFDKNENGKITLQDFISNDITVQNIIRKLDKDNDNDIDRKDFQIVIEQFADIVVDMIDLNKDRYVSKQEYDYSLNATSIKSWEKYFMFWFDLVDLNEDGMISDADFPKLAPFQNILKNKNLKFSSPYYPVALILKKIDTNEDYQLSKMEFTQFFVKMLNKIDITKDGVTTLKEILLTMKIYKFPENVINSTEVLFRNMYNVSRENIEITFNEYDKNEDDKMDVNEITTIFTKPMSKLFISNIQFVYTSFQPSAHVRGLTAFDLIASVYSFFTFLEIPLPGPLDIAIQVIDKNSDGKITLEETETIISVNEKLFAHIDINNDNAIDQKDIRILLETFAAELIGIFDILKKNGFVSRNEVSYSLSAGASTVKGWEGFLLFLFDFVDVTEDGIISDSDFPDIPVSLAPSQMLETFLLRNKTSFSKLISHILKAMKMEDKEKYQLRRIELIQFLRKMTNKLDNNNDGDITLKEVLQTMKVFKFPGKLIKIVKHHYKDIFNAAGKIWEVIFNEFDTNGDGQMDNKELSTVFTKPLTSSLVIGVEDIYESLPSSPRYAKEISHKEIENALYSTYNFLQF